MQALQAKNADPSKVSIQPKEQDTIQKKDDNPNKNPFLRALEPPKTNSFLKALQSPLQTKLSIGQPNDQYEQEADRVAEQVVSTPEPVQRKCTACAQEENIQAKPLASQISPLGASFTQRKCTACEQEEKLQPKLIQKKGEAGTADSQIESQINSSKGSGSPMDAQTLGVMNNSFGADFSGVRIHTGSQSVQMNQQLSAKAFTVGNDVHFNQGEYNPGSTEGKKLLAHELTHVLQQEKSIQRKIIQRAPQEEPQKYSVIDYKKAKSDNIKSWYEQYKFYNLFKEQQVYPGSTPIAYANRVYELQMRLEEIYGDKWQATEAGILEPVIRADTTLIKVLAIAMQHHKNPETSYGLDVNMLERLHSYYTRFEEKAPPLVSEYFSGNHQLSLVNRNPHFTIHIDDRGEYVKKIQEALIKLNYNIGSDLKENKEKTDKEPSSVFGKGTQQAVINFQKDSGFEGKDVDGIVGQMTLRLLDKRLGAPVFKNLAVVAGSAYAFHVPVMASDLLMDKEKLKQDLLRRTLQIAFPITNDQIDVLLRSGWHWKNYQELQQSEVDLGYKKVTINKSDYQSVVGKVDEKAGHENGETTEEKLERQTLDLLKTGKLYELNKQISDLEALISLLRSSGDPEAHGRDIPWKEIHENEEKLKTLKNERQEELNRLGITLSDYEKMKTDFIHVFEKFAVQTAFQMLSENEMQANIEAQHYAKIEEVSAIKAALSDLSDRYHESEKLWWQARSLEDTDGKSKSEYSNESDYRSKNRRLGGRVFAKLYNPENASNMYKALDEKPSPHFAPWKEKEDDIVKILQEVTKKFPILAYPKLELRSNASGYSGKSDEDLQKMLLGIIKGTDDEKGIKQNIEATRKDLTENPEKIWELPLVVLRAQYSLGVIDGVPAELIKAKQKDVADKGFWENVGLAILGIGLGLLALASGPVGWLALAASVGVGAYDAYRTYNEITFKKTIAHTALNPASALGTDDPSYFWFWVSLVSVGIDVLQAAKVIKSVAKGIELAKGVTAGLEEARVVKLTELAAAGGEATAKGKVIVKEIEEIEHALAKVKSTEFAENIKLLEPLKANPMAVAVMSEALQDKKIVQAVTSLGKLVEKEMFENALKFYASVGRKSLDELPEMMRLVKEGGLQNNKRLMTELLSDPRTQRVLLDTQDPKFIADQYQLWEATIKAGKSKSFVAYLETQNLTTRLATDTKLVDMFGEGFTTLSNAVKNRQILRTVEPRLLDALHAGSLSPEIRKALEILLNSDVLAQSTRLSSAQQRLLHELRLLGSVIETQTDFSKLVGLLDNPASRRALWEGSSQLAGKDRYMEIILKASGDKLPAPDVLDDLIRIGPMTDEGTIQSLISPTGQKLRQVLAANPEAVTVLKKCASPCLPPFITPEQVLQVNNLMKGKSRDELLRIREFLYTHRHTEDAFKSALNSLETNFAEALKDVKLPILKKPTGFAVSDEILRAMTDLGLPASELNKIMEKAAALKGGGSDIITDLLRVLQFEKNVSLKNFDILIKGLSEGSYADFRAARHLLDEAERFANASVSGLKKFKYSGLEKADLLLGRFSLSELNSLMNAHWSESFVNSLYEITEKLPGLKNNEIVDLLTKAGGGSKGDLARLNEILRNLPSATYDEGLKAIQAADSFAADIAKAMSDTKGGYEALAKRIWGNGVIIEEGVIKAKDIITKGGDTAYGTLFRLGQGDALVQGLVSGGTLNKEKWKVFRKVIEDTDIHLTQKILIMGEMWTRVHAQAFLNQGYKVHREVGLMAKAKVAGMQDIRADLVLIRGNEMIIVECKSGMGVYERAQKVIYPLLEEGKFESIMLTGNEKLAEKYTDASTKLSFIPIREAEIIP